MRPKKKKAPVIIVVIIVIMLIAAAGGSKKESPKKVNEEVAQVESTNSNNQENSEETKSKEENKEKPITEEEQVFGVGDVVDLNGIQATLLAVEESNGKEYMEPKEGNVYLLCKFELTNGTKEDINISSMLSLDTYVDEYSTSESITAEAAAGSGDSFNGTVAPGKKLSGTVGYEVAAGWKKLEVHFTPDFWTNSKIIFQMER